MNKEQFSALVNNRSNLNAADLKGLEEVVSNFPFAQAAHILIAKGNNDYGSMLAGRKIKKAAAYTPDRKSLKELINTPSPNREISSEEPDNAEGKVTSAAPEENKIDSPKPHSSNIFIEELDKTLEDLKNARESYAGSEKEKDEIKENPQNKISGSQFPGLKLQKEIPDEISSENKADNLLNYLDFLEKKRKRPDKQKQNYIIEQFIQQGEPSISKLSPEEVSEQQEDLSLSTQKKYSGPVSENFAKILIKQGKNDQAIEVLEQLILKIPEKSAYFESQIKELKEKNK